MCPAMSSFRKSDPDRIWSKSKASTRVPSPCKCSLAGHQPGSVCATMMFVSAEDLGSSNIGSVPIWSQYDHQADFWQCQIGGTSIHSSNRSGSKGRSALFTAKIGTLRWFSDASVVHHGLSQIMSWAAPAADFMSSFPENFFRYPKSLVLQQSAANVVFSLKEQSRKP